jgi:cysteine desulfurase
MLAMTNALSTYQWVYLDNNATTRTGQRVVDAMIPYYCEHYANGSSMHDMGAAATDAVEVARQRVSTLLGAKRASEIVFTSGGSESNNTAILSALETQAGRTEIVTSAVEHSAVLALCDHLERSGRAKIHRIPVDRDGRLNLDAYGEALSHKTALVSMQWANNETGVIFPVEQLAAMAHDAGALFHSDGVQAAGKAAIHLQDTEIDMLSVSAHKMHGPKGIGALYVRHGVRLAPLVHGGRQERGRRAGTENTPAIVGFGVAAELAQQALPLEMPRLTLLRDRMEREIIHVVPGTMTIGAKNHRLPNTLQLAFADVEADSILMSLNRHLIAASSGSACSAGSMEPSHVLRAMKIPFSCIRGAVRFSLSRENNDGDVDRLLDVLPAAVLELQAMSVPMEAAYD